MEVIVGVAIVLLGASGAATATRRLPAAGRGRWVLPALIGAGALVGGGAALVRGWELPGTVAAGAVLVPLMAIVVRAVEARGQGGRP